jgi:hypothetical protein
MLNPQNSEFLVQSPKGPLHEYIHKSAQLVAQNTGKNLNETLNQTDKEGRTWLHMAVSLNDLKLFEKLLDMEVSINTGRSRKIRVHTSLVQAVARGRLQFLQCAIERHLTSGCKLINELAMKSLIDCLLDLSTGLETLKEDLTKLFQQDARAREYLKTEIDQLRNIDEDKSAPPTTLIENAALSFLESILTEQEG